MSDYKGVGTVFVRSLVRSKDPEVESALLAQLTPEDRQRWHTMTATEWVPIEFATRLFEVASPLVYPGRANPIRLIGRDLAGDNLRGVYRYIARVLTIPFLLEQSATFWRTYHRHGVCHLDRHGTRDVEFVVADYPRMPERFRECMCGWISGTLELAGAKKTFVTKTDDDPAAWRWAIRWT